MPDVPWLLLILKPFYAANAHYSALLSVALTWCFTAPNVRLDFEMANATQRNCPNYLHPADNMPLPSHQLTCKLYSAARKTSLLLLWISPNVRRSDPFLTVRHVRESLPKFLLPNPSNMNKLVGRSRSKYVFQNLGIKAPAFSGFVSCLFFKHRISTAFHSFYIAPLSLPCIFFQSSPEAYIYIEHSHSFIHTHT